MPLGAPTMLTIGDEGWLYKAHPGLAPTDAGVAGKIEFIASYNEDTGLFQLLDCATDDVTHGAVLEGKFNIRIEERTERVYSALPALFIEEIEPVQDRHFGGDKSACLCSPLEEGEFLTPAFKYKPFIERLVIPFLYGQLFYSLNQRWPWPEYAHSATGLLESYGQHPIPAKIEWLLQTLARYLDAWPAIKTALQRRDYIRGHTPCFCQKKDQMRRCHPNALLGIRQLHSDIQALKVELP